MHRYNIFKRLSGKLKKTKKRSWILIAVISALSVFMIWLGVNLSPISDNPETQRVSIRQGMSVEAVADMLYKKELIRSPFAFTFWSRLTGSNIQAGEHLIAPSYSVIQIADKLRTTAKNEISVRIPSGYDLKSLREVFKKYGWTDSEITDAYNKKYDSPILYDKPAKASLEGYIYPDTYNVFISDDLSALIQKAIDNMYKKVMTDGVWTSKKSNGMTFYKTLTLASIVYKEVGNPTDQKKIAGVFFNRLNVGMRLDADPTFRFAYNNGLCHENKPSCNSEYNTRLHTGLPPGPISTVQISAIKAVVNPIKSGYYYFLAGDDGKIYYAMNDEQHHLNIINHCRVNCSF